MKKILFIACALITLPTVQQTLLGASVAPAQETKKAAALPVAAEDADADYAFIQKVIHERYPYKVTDPLYAVDAKKGYSPKFLADSHCGRSVAFMLSLLTPKDATPIMTSTSRIDTMHTRPIPAITFLREDTTIANLVAAIYLEEDMHSFLILKGRSSNGQIWFRTFESCAELYTLADWINSGKLTNLNDSFFQERHTEFGEGKKLSGDGYLMPKYLVTTTNYYNQKDHPHNLHKIKIVLYPYELQKGSAASLPAAAAGEGD